MSRIHLLKALQSEMAKSKYDIVDLFNSGHRNLMQKNKRV